MGYGPGSFLLGRDEIVRDEYQIWLQSCLCRKPVRPIRQAHSPEALEGRAQSSTVVRWTHYPEEDRGEAHSKSGPEVLEGSITHP